MFFSCADDEEEDEKKALFLVVALLLKGDPEEGLLRILEERQVNGLSHMHINEITECR